MKIKLTKNCPTFLEIFNGERNGKKIGKMSFTAQKDVEEEKIKNNHIY